MEIIALIKITIIFILLCFSAFFSASETALFSLGTIKLFKLGESGHSRASLLEELLAHPRRLIISLLVGNDITDIALSAVAASLFISLAGLNGKWLSIAVMTPLIFFLGEVLPKTIAVSHSETVSLRVARPIAFFARIIFPLRWLMPSFFTTRTIWTSSGTWVRSWSISAPCTAVPCRSILPGSTSAGDTPNCMRRLSSPMEP